MLLVSPRVPRMAVNTPASMGRLQEAASLSAEGCCCLHCLPVCDREVSPPPPPCLALYKDHVGGPVALYKLLYEVCAWNWFCLCSGHIKPSSGSKYSKRISPMPDSTSCISHLILIIISSRFDHLAFLKKK